MMRSAERVLSREQLVSKVREAKQAGATIILANGCFDVLHVGHVRYLTAAKQLGDLLVVGINSDDQVKQQKGAGRPIVPDTERAEIVASLEPVDYVSIFSEPTVEELLRAVRPDVQAKGTDYTKDTVPEREVNAYSDRKTRKHRRHRAHACRPWPRFGRRCPTRKSPGS
jgi:rfaE bifunctional protein nucleotidyltransferase chain/domain